MNLTIKTCENCSMFTTNENHLCNYCSNMKEAFATAKIW